jgi:hypothetical protein
LLLGLALSGRVLWRDSGLGADPTRELGEAVLKPVIAFGLVEQSEPRVGCAWPGVFARAGRPAGAQWPWVVGGAGTCSSTRWRVRVARGFCSSRPAGGGSVAVGGAGTGTVGEVAVAEHGSALFCLCGDLDLRTLRGAARRGLEVVRWDATR